MKQLISIQQAEELITTHLPDLAQETVPLAEAHGRVLKEAIKADRPIPPYDRAMMDGIAISYQSFADGVRDFPITGTQAAGQPALQLENAAHCIEVMTGAMTPKGSDCVIKVEDIDVKDNVASLKPSCTASLGQHIHPLGSDQQENSILVPDGSYLGSAEVAIAASVGQTELSVIKQPRILLITTGDEVISPEEIPLQHQIRRSHSAAICGSIHNHRLGKITHTHVPDTAEALEESLRDGLGKYDIILLTGGISMGKFDYVAPVMESLVGSPLFHGIAQRPGKPFAFWPGSTPVFALPGNPVSVMACLARYILPALRKMGGLQWQPQTLLLAKNTTWNAPFPGLVASHITKNQLHAAPPRNSGDYSALAGAQGICELPSTSPAGTPLRFYPW